MKRIALLLPTNKWFCPYVDLYTSVLEEEGVSYDFILWNKDGKQEGGISFYRKVKKNSISKLLGYYKYSRFIKKHLNSNNYDGIIVFGPQVGIFISGLLRRKYKSRYIFDYRDLSIEQSKIFSKRFLRVLESSFMNVISSPGFKRCLPSDFNYIISHNFNEEKAKKSLKGTGSFSNGEVIKILTIGGIRDFDSNIEILDSLGSKQNYEIKFVGRGPAASALEQYSEKNNYNNVQFSGFYEKKEEDKYIKECTFLNIHYPPLLSHETALSNRFYNSLIFKRPMIVTKGQIQGDFCELYNLGVAIENGENLGKKLENWLKENNYEDYAMRCDTLLASLLNEQNTFILSVKNFIGSL